MRVVITGATGFLGEHVVARRPAGAADVVVFARPSGRAEALARQGLDVRLGDLADRTALDAALAGADVLLNVASLGFGHAPAIVSAAVGAGIRRAVFVSTTAIFTQLPAPSRRVRLEAERVIAESSLDFTILRPTMIYGSPRDRNIWRLIQFLRRSPVVPLVGSGTRLHQPVFVEDVASAIWAVLQTDASRRQAYDVAGREPLSLRALIETICRQLNRRVAVIGLPIRAMIWLARAARRVPLAPSISDEQILRLDEDKAFDIAAARQAFGYDPLSFEAGLARELLWLEGSGTPRAAG